MPVNEPRLFGDPACIHSSTRREDRLQCYGKGVKNPPRLPGSYLVIELANRCSLACVHCAVADTSHSHFDRTGYFDVDVADALFEDLSSQGIAFDTLILFWLGEPLIHPEFSRIWQSAVRAAARSGTFGKIEVHSNATHLSDRKVACLLNESDVPQVIHFSLDATDRDLYLKVKGKDRYDQVVQNIEHFLAEKARLNAPWPRPVFQFIVGSNNVEQVGAFRDQWEKACEKVGLPFRTVAGHVPNGEDAIIFFLQLDCPTASLQAAENKVFRDAMNAQGLVLPEQADAGQQVGTANHSVCAGFWKSPVISWDGKVTTCTRDSELHNEVGRLQDTPFSELWWNESMRRRRKMVSAGDYSDMKVCSSCFIPKSLNYTGITAEEVKSWEAAK